MSSLESFYQRCGFGRPSPFDIFPSFGPWNLEDLTKLSVDQEAFESDALSFEADKLDLQQIYPSSQD